MRPPEPPHVQLAPGHTGSGPEVARAKTGSAAEALEEDAEDPSSVGFARAERLQGQDYPMLRILILAGCCITVPREE